MSYKGGMRTSHEPKRKLNIIVMRPPTHPHTEVRRDDAGGLEVLDEPVKALIRHRDTGIARVNLKNGNTTHRQVQ